MPLYNEPVRLETLALQSVGNYISDQGVQLLDLVESVHYIDNNIWNFLTGRSKWYHFKRNVNIQTPPTWHEKAYRSPESINVMVTVCSRLKELLNNFVPFNLANEVTVEILRQLNNKFNLGWMKCTVSERALRIFLRTVIHSKTTELEFPRKWKHVKDYVLCELQSSPDLKVLYYIKNGERDCMSSLPGEVRTIFQIHVDKILESFKHLMFLEHLTLQVKCTDSLLDVLSQTCTQLKTLNVRESMKVTDKSIGYISKFKHLETLDITHTGIHICEQWKVIASLNPTLKSYGTCSVDEESISALSRLCPDLTSLSVWKLDIRLPFCNLLAFQKLESLQIETFCSNTFRWFLKYVPHLKTLSITGFNVNISRIMKNCTNIPSISFKVHHIRQNDTTVEDFSSLKHLTLVTKHSSEAAIMLSKCHNLETLQLITGVELYVRYLPYIYARNPLSQLQEVSFGTLLGPLPPNAMLTITKHCPNLTNCKILVESNKLSGHYFNFPGVVDSDLWFQITNSADEVYLKCERGSYDKRTTCGLHSKIFCYDVCPEQVYRKKREYDSD